jgi:hypothetical protein
MADRNTAQERESQKIFPYISSNIYVTLMTTVFLVTALYIGKDGVVSQGPDAFTTFALGWFFLTQIGFTGIETPSGIATAVGLKTPVKGLNIILGIMGVGIAVMIYSLVGQMATILPQSQMTASILSPLYNPYTAFPQQFSIMTNWTGFIEVAIYNFGLVATFEELYKIILIKNIANWFFVTRGWTKRSSIGAGLLGSFTVWGSWHFVASWNLSILAIISSIGFGIIFYGAWIIADFLGALSQPGKIVLTSILVMPGITSHGTWNTLQAIGGTGLTFAAEFGIGMSLVISGLISLYIVKSRFQVVTPTISQPNSLR